jgi:molybdopterin-guanine dinucleotide biosynthesis protein A
VNPPVPFGMIVLAGGRAARLGGADKPGLVVGGRTLLAAVLAAGAGAGARPVIVVGPQGGPGSGEPSDPRVVREEPPGAGPVPALRRGLAELAALPRGAGDASDAEDARDDSDTGDTAWVAVLAADLPFLRAAHLRALLTASAGQDGAVLTDDGGRPQWLAGCWRVAALRRAVAGYRGASLHGLLSPLHPASVWIEPGPGEPPPWLDCDTEADLSRARQYPAR